MPETIQTVLKLLGYLGGTAVVLAAVAGFAYWLFKIFAEKWLSSKFDKEMQTLRHSQARELEELRFKIQGLLDRTIKLHQHEFEVLPKAWDLMVEAYAEAQGFLSALQSYPDLNRMNSVQLDEFLKESPLLNWQVDEINSSSDKMKYYREAIFWHRLQKADTTLREFNIYFWKNRIFLTKELQEKFTGFHKIISDALFERQMNEEMKGEKPEREKQNKFRKEGDLIRTGLEECIHSRLWETKGEAG